MGLSSNKGTTHSLSLEEDVGHKSTQLTLSKDQTEVSTKLSSERAKNGSMDNITGLFLSPFIHSYTQCTAVVNHAPTLFPSQTLETVWASLSASTTGSTKVLHILLASNLRETRDTRAQNSP